MSEQVEPWLRGTLTEVDAVRRQVLHALQLTAEDAQRWCASLSDAEMSAQPLGLPPVAFHLRHIARSLDRLLTYAEGLQLSAAQLDALRLEHAPGATTGEVMRELLQALQRSEERVLRFAAETFEDPRGVGRQQLPATVGGLLVHCAEHTQRHIGQAITTAKAVLSLRTSTGEHS